MSANVRYYSQQSREPGRKKDQMKMRKKSAEMFAGEISRAKAHRKRGINITDLILS